MLENNFIGVDFQETEKAETKEKKQLKKVSLIHFKNIFMNNSDKNGFKELTHQIIFIYFSPLQSIFLM